MMNKKLLSAVTSLSSYHGFSRWKTFWEENLTGKKKLSSATNMENCGCHNVRKHKEIKVSDKHVTLDISLNFDSLEKMKSVYSESKGKLEIFWKGLITSFDLRAKVKPHKY